jgi:hypothetical protein
VQSTTDVHHQIAHILLAETAPGFAHATALDTAMDMLAPQPARGERLIRLRQGGEGSGGGIAEAT